MKSIKYGIMLLAAFASFSSCDEHDFLNTKASPLITFLSSSFTWLAKLNDYKNVMVPTFAVPKEVWKESYTVISNAKDRKSDFLKEEPLDFYSPENSMEKRRRMPLKA